MKNALHERTMNLSPDGIDDPTVGGGGTGIDTGGTGNGSGDGGGKNKRAY